MCSKDVNFLFTIFLLEAKRPAWSSPSELLYFQEPHYLFLCGVDWRVFYCCTFLWQELEMYSVKLNDFMNQLKCNMCPLKQIIFGWRGRVLSWACFSSGDDSLIETFSTVNVSTSLWLNVRFGWIIVGYFAIAFLLWFTTNVCNILFLLVLVNSL